MVSLTDIWACYDDRLIIEPRKGKRESSLPSTACLVFAPKDLIILIRLLSGRTVKRTDMYLSKCYCVLSSDGKPAWCLIGPILGAPQAAMVIEKAIALGVRDIIGIGWCGSLQEKVKIGDVVIPTSYFSEEGTSSHYPRNISKQRGVIESESSSLFLKILESKGISIHKGPVWTTDAPFRETISKVRFYINKGALGVDMETSACICVTSYRGVRFTMFLLTSDTLYTLKWHPGMHSRVFLKRRRQVMKALVEVMNKLPMF